MGIHAQGRKALQVMTVHIKNGRVIDPKNRVDAKQDVFISAGKIVALGKAPAGFRAERTIDAANLVVCPGLIDLSARLREPGFEYKATLASEMQAVFARGGAWGTPGRARPGSACRGFPRPPRPSRPPPSCNSCAPRAPASIYADVPLPKASRSCARRRRRGCPSRATQACISRTSRRP